MRPVRRGRALIKVGYGCNENCTFCHTLYERHIDDTGERVARKIDRAAALGARMVVLSGGEPTIRRELVAWARRSAARGMQFGLVTNAQVLSYPELVDRLYDAGLRYAYVSLHGGEAKIHNAMIRSEGFDATWRALELLSERDLELTVNGVITTTNLQHLRALVDRVAGLGSAALQLSMVEAKGGGDLLFDSIVPPVSDVAAAVVDAMRYARDNHPGLTVTQGGLPWCLLGEDAEAYGDLRTHDFTLMTEVWEDDFHPIDERNRVHPAPCGDCTLRGRCPGLYAAYAERRGHDELQPRLGLRSNSCNFVPVETRRWPASQSCPVARDGASPFASPRAIWVRRGDELTRYETQTRDFSDADLHALKERGQLYVDISDADAPTDFSRQLRKLDPLETCRSCEARESCAGGFAMSEADVFSLSDDGLRERLASLEGDVLEVGCGDGRYLNTLERACASGRMSYRGVDPDADAVASLRARHPWATIEVSGIEDVELPEASLDHVLVLQSYNHLREPRELFERVVRALRPGGTVIVADNVAFGLIRDSDQAQRGEHSAAGFEHFHNHGADQVLSILEGLPLKHLARRPVTPDSSNQWVIHLERVAG